MSNKRTPHILNTSSNLLGFTFLVLSSIKGFGLSNTGLVDEFLDVCAVLFSVSSLISFVALRVEDEDVSRKIETWADYVFLVGLIAVVLVTLFLGFDVISFN